MIKDQIDENTRDRNVKPNRKNVAGELPMRLVTAFKTEIKRPQNERCDNGCEDRVRGKYCEIDGPDHPFAGKTRGAQTEIIRAESVMGEIAN